jgi:glutaconyl-CoA decarboxylase subunit alpha
MIYRMNKFIEEFVIKSRPIFCAQDGMLEEIVDMRIFRPYVLALKEAAYENPKFVCIFHKVLLQRIVKNVEPFVKKINVVEFSLLLEVG